MDYPNLLSNNNIIDYQNFQKSTLKFEIHVHLTLTLPSIRSDFPFFFFTDQSLRLFLVMCWVKIIISFCEIICWKKNLEMKIFVYFVFFKPYQFTNLKVKIWSYKPIRQFRILFTNTYTSINIYQLLFFDLLN